MSKRKFEGLVRKWRRLLHAYDVSAAGGAAAAGSVVSGADEEREAQALLEAAAERNFADSGSESDSDADEFAAYRTEIPSATAATDAVSEPDDDSALWAMLHD